MHYIKSYYCHSLCTAVYNEWYDLIEMIIATIGFKFYWSKNYRTSYDVGIAIQRGNLKLLKSLFPNGQITNEFMTDQFVIYKAISRILYNHNFDMYNYLKESGLLTDKVLQYVMKTFNEVIILFDFMKNYEIYRYVYR